MSGLGLSSSPHSEKMQLLLSLDSQKSSEARAAGKPSPHDDPKTAFESTKQLLAMVRSASSSRRVPKTPAQLESPGCLVPIDFEELTDLFYSLARLFPALYFTEGPSALDDSDEIPDLAEVDDADTDRAAYLFAAGVALPHRPTLARLEELISDPAVEEQRAALLKFLSRVPEEVPQIHVISYTMETGEDS
eukprot:gnl/Ergobibamus_cyprinoides/1566.p1 GENE.gnl/Ergobibamus_cyprinoides/1566~~gnl/Ergobibamus_cyprinoides/1566.p1  ORF type:complete len:191 (+),score=59.75 gnl/Ergobibamus_cyprinoides/1566:52-624(+)